MRLSKIVAAATQAKTNIRHVEQARAKVQVDGTSAYMTLNFEKPSRYYIHIFGPGVKARVVEEVYDPRAAVKEWFNWMKKLKGKLIEKRASFFALVEGALKPDAKIEDLTREQQIVILATAAYKASYAPYGKNYRYYEAWLATGITLDQWNRAKKELIDHKVLRSNGALSPQAKKLVKGKIGQTALRKLAKPGWKPSLDDRSEMEDKLRS